MAVWLTMNMSYVGQGDYSNSSKIAVSVDVHWSHVSYNRDGGALTVTVDGVSDYRTVAFNAGETSSGSQNIYSSYWNISQPGGSAKTVSAYATFQATNSTAATPASGSLYLSSTGGSSGGSSDGGDSGGEDGGDTGEDPGTNPGGGSDNPGVNLPVTRVYLRCRNLEGITVAKAEVESSSNDPERGDITITSDPLYPWRIRYKNGASYVVVEKTAEYTRSSFGVNPQTIYIFEVFIDNKWVHSIDGSSSFYADTVGFYSDPDYNYGGVNGNTGHFLLKYVTNHCRTEVYHAGMLFETVTENKSTEISSSCAKDFTFVFIADEGYELSECSINGVACDGSGTLTAYNEEYTIVASAVPKDSGSGSGSGSGGDSGDMEFSYEFTMKYVVGEHCKIELYIGDYLSDEITSSKSVKHSSTGPMNYTLVFTADEGYKLSECSIDGIACDGTGTLTASNGTYTIVASAVPEGSGSDGGDSGSDGDDSGSDGDDSTDQTACYLYLAATDGVNVTAEKIYLNSSTTSAGNEYGELNFENQEMHDGVLWYKCRIWDEDWLSFNIEPHEGYTIDTYIINDAFTDEICEVDCRVTGLLYDSSDNTWAFDDTSTNAAWVYISATKNDVGSIIKIASSVSVFEDYECYIDTELEIDNSCVNQYVPYYIYIDNGTDWDLIL